MWIDRAVKRLLPREEHFFDLLERGALLAREISDLLAECCTASPGDREAFVGRMRQARIAGTGTADDPVRNDALVPVLPVDAERVAPDRVELLDHPSITMPPSTVQTWPVT